MFVGVHDIVIYIIHAFRIVLYNHTKVSYFQLISLKPIKSLFRI